MRFDPQLVAALVVTTCVGWLMLVAGLGKSGLELRRRRRVCPSCGHEIQHRGCACWR